MHDTPTITPPSYRSAWLEGPWYRHCDPASLRRAAATWRARARYRGRLEELWKTAPHLIEDIGLKKWQVEAEIAKPFWQA